MAQRVARQLLRDLSTPARSALSLPARSTILAPRRKASTYGREPPPQPATPSQQLAERALLQKLSTLSPDQIAALLSAPPDAPIPPHPTGGYHHPPAPEPTARWKKLLLRLTIATVSLLVGHELGEMLIDSSELLTWAARGVELPEGDDVIPPRERALALFNYLNDLPSMEFTMPMRAVYNVDEAGTIYILRPELAADLLKELSANHPPGFHAKARTMISSDSDVMPQYIDSGPPHENEPPFAFPAAQLLINSVDPESVARRRRSLIAGVYNTPNTLGLLNHTVLDPATGDIFSVVVFGRRMCGWPGVVHGGALATVTLDTAVRFAAAGFFGEIEFRPSKLTVTYHHPLSPCRPVFAQAHLTGYGAVLRQEYLSQMEAQGPEALANALKPIDHPSKRMSQEAVDELAKEVVRKQDEKARLMTVVRMWSEENGGIPVCDAQITFLKLTPEEEAELKSLDKA